MNDRNIEAGYTWSDGSPVTFLNWHPGEPNDLNNVEKCTEMNPGDTLWNDAVCYLLNGYVCKQPLGKVYVVNRNPMDREGFTLSSHLLA